MIKYIVFCCFVFHTVFGQDKNVTINEERPIDQLYNSVTPLEYDTMLQYYVE